MRNWRANLSLLLLLVTLSAGTAWAQNGKFLPQLGKDIEAQFLYPVGKNYDDQTLFPIVVEYKNISTKPQEFHLDWTLGLPLPPEYRRLVLEPGSTKRLPLLLPPRQANQLYNVTLNEQSLNPNVQSRPRMNIVGLLAPKGDTLEYLRSMQLEKNAYYNNSKPTDENEEYNTLQALSQLDADVFPDHWGPLQSLSYLVCYDLQSLSLSTRGYQAIVKWVQQGGTLILVSNGLPTEYEGTPLQAILPFQAKDVVTTDTTIQLSGRVSDGAEVLVGDKESPIVVSQEVLKGKVILFTVPALTSDVLGKDRTRDIWRDIFVNINQKNNYNGNTAFGNSLLDDMPELPRAQAGWVALFVILYGVIVGPINLSLLRKKDKMLWSFVTVPVIALLFASGAYIVNRVIRPSTPVLRELGWLHTVSGSPVGVVESEQLLFSPQADTFEIESDKNSFFSIHQHQYRAFSNSRQFGLYQTTPDGGLKSALEMGTWDIQRFHAYAVADLKRPITASFVSVGQELSLDTPIGSLGATAILLHPKLGASKAFQFEAGQKTYDLDFSDTNSVHYTEDERYPGRTKLARNVSDHVTNSQVVQADRATLFFWTDELNTSLTLEREGVLRHDFLVTLELKV